MCLRVTTLVLILGVALGARAQSGQERQSARDSFESAEHAFAQSDYATALRLYQHAFELAPHDATRFNVALCLEHLGRFREAALEYDAAALSASLDEATHARARQLAVEARSKLGVLVVGGSPAGTRVLVDGEPLCALPCRVSVDPGQRRVNLENEPASSERTVTARANETATVRFETSGSMPIRASRVTSQPRARAPTESDASSPVGPLTWIGGATAIVAAAGIIVFGARAQDLHHEYYDETHAESARKEGAVMRDLCNVSIGLAVVGAALVVVDLLLLDTSDEHAPRAAGDRLVIAF